MADPAPDPTPDPKPDPAPDPNPDPAGATFTQTDVDRIVKDRLKRESLKYEGFEDFKAKAAELDKIREGEKTDLEKAREALAAAEKVAADAAAQAKDSLLKAAVVSEAATRNVVDPEAAFVLIDRSVIEFDDTGSPTNVATAMDALIEAKPYLTAKSGKPAGDVDQGARGKAAEGQLSRADLQSMTPEEIVKAQQEGRLAELTGAAK